MQRLVLFKVAAFVLIKNYVAGSFRVSDLSCEHGNRPTVKMWQVAGSYLRWPELCVATAWK